MHIPNEVLSQPSKYQNVYKKTYFSEFPFQKRVELHSTNVCGLIRPILKSWSQDKVVNAHTKFHHFLKKCLSHIQIYWLTACKLYCYISTAHSK